MEAIFAKLIDQLNSSVFVLLGILAAAFWAVYRIAKLIEQFTHHKVKIDKVDSLSDRLIELKVKVDLIYQNTNPNRTVAAASPISLTASGHEIATKIKADEIMAKYLSQLTALVELVVDCCKPMMSVCNDCPTTYPAALSAALLIW